MAKRISIINFKGGVGKTTLAFHLGTGLARYYDGKKVLLVDVDHQSSLSVICLGTDQWDECSQEKRTINEVFRLFVGRSVMPNDGSIVVKHPMSGKGLRDYIPAHYRSMDLVPANLELDNLEIELTASYHGDGTNSEWNKRTLICRWIEEAGIDDLYDYIIFDCPPATKVVSQNAIAASHGYVIPVVPEAVMQFGVPHLIDLIKEGIDHRLKRYADESKDEPRMAHVPDTKLVGVVVTRIQSGGPSDYTNDATVNLRDLQGLVLRPRGHDLLEPYIRQGVAVSESLRAGVPVYDRKDSRNVKLRKQKPNEAFRDLVDELKRRIDAL